MPAELARQWFVSSEGIDRHVIVTDIQRYLGNDATVRPGTGTGENEVRKKRQLQSVRAMCLRSTGCPRILDQGIPQPHDRRHPGITVNTPACVLTPAGDDLGFAR